jgi:integrase
MAYVFVQHLRITHSLPPLSGSCLPWPSAFLFRSLAGKSGGGKSGLSMAFKRIMEQAEVDAGVARLSSGAKGRSFSLRSFHSLRHSFISALANSGVSSELRRRLSRHATEEMHAVYTHHELETIRQAVSAIPRLPALGCSRIGRS